MPELSRRELILKAIIGIPLLGSVVTLLFPTLRLLRPTLPPGPLGLNPVQDRPPTAGQVVATLSELSKDWSVVKFIFIQQNVEYTRERINESLIPGFAIKLPEQVVKSLPPEVGNKIVANKNIVVFSRICAHLGCIFNYFNTTSPDSLAKVQKDYNFPGARPNQGYFACPCHFSVYDLTQVDPGKDNKLAKVVSGPAPRPAYTLDFHLEGDKVVVTGMEAGAVA